MSKQIKSVSARHMGHLHLEFTDGTQAVIVRGVHEKHALQAGDFWPPIEVGDVFSVSSVNRVNPDVAELHKDFQENANAVDAKASEAPAVESESADSGAAGQDEVGAAPQSGDGPQKEGQPATEEAKPADQAAEVEPDPQS